MKPVPLIEIAAAVSDGSAIDWDRLDRATEPSLRQVVRHLRLVERIASVHAALPVMDFARSLHDSLRRGPDRAAENARLTTWGSLTIEGMIGRGSYADVYLARDPRLDRPVALKLLRHREGHPADTESAVIEEARLLARVRHPNVVTVYGAEWVDGRAIGSAHPF